MLTKQNTILITDLEQDRLTPAFSGNAAAICMCMSDSYSPYAGVALQSFAEHCSPDNRYDLIFITKDLSEENKRRFLSQVKEMPCISLRFLDTRLVSNVIKDNTYGQFSIETMFKLLMFSPLFSLYDKMAMADCDLVYGKDPALFYKVDTKGCFFAGAECMVVKKLKEENIIHHPGNGAPEMTTRDYITDYLNLSLEDAYVNFGVGVFDLKKCREADLFRKTIELNAQKPFWFNEQDIMNILCRGCIAPLPAEWNALCESLIVSNMEKAPIKDEDRPYFESFENYGILHYAGLIKPWQDPCVPYGEEFWKYARRSPWYEIVLDRLWQDRMHAAMREEARRRSPRGIMERIRRRLHL